MNPSGSTGPRQTQRPYSQVRKRLFDEDEEFCVLSGGYLRTGSKKRLRR
jgi:hypothetical protein